MMLRMPSEADEKFYAAQLCKMFKPMEKIAGVPIYRKGSTGHYVKTIIAYIYATGASDELKTRENIFLAALYFAKQSGKRVKVGKVPEKIKKIAQSFSKKFIE